MTTYRTISALVGMAVDTTNGLKSMSLTNTLHGMTYDFSGVDIMFAFLLTHN